MKFGKKPAGYKFSIYNHEKEPLKSVINVLMTLNLLLDRFDGLKATGAKYGYYLLTNNLFTITQSLKRGIQHNDYNLLECLFRQSADLMINSHLIFSGIDHNNLVRHVTLERLRMYAAYCLWSRIRLLEIELDASNYQPLDGDGNHPEYRTEDFVEIRSKEFHDLMDLFGTLKLNSEKAQLEVRARDGERLYSFITAVNPDYKSVSDYIRRNLSSAALASYSKVASRLHGSWVSVHPVKETPNLLQSSSHTILPTDKEYIIKVTLFNVEISTRYVLQSLSYLWPEMVNNTP